MRFSIGLWVGRSATADTLEQISKQVTEYKNDNSPRAQSPFPLVTCPWCGTTFERECFRLDPSKTKPRRSSSAVAAGINQRQRGARLANTAATNAATAGGTSAPTSTTESRARWRSA